MAREPSLDPYRPPPPTEGAYFAPGRVPKPAGFVIICVIAIALGGLGFMHALFAIAELTLGDPFQWLLESPAARGAPSFEELSNDFENAVHALQDRYRLLLLPLALLRLALTACLVVGGIWCLRGRPPGRKLLTGTFAAALLFEICDSIAQGFIAREMAEPFRAYGQGIDALQAPPSNPAPNLGELLLMGLLWGIMCVFYLCQVGKIVYYLWGLIYLRRPALDPLFTPQAQLADETGAP